MKRLFMAMLLLAGLTAMAQNSHLTFKGIPIDGTQNEVVKKLEQKGFTYEVDGDVCLTGDFAAHKDCHIYVIEIMPNIVSRIGVVFPEQSTWKQLYYDYISLKSMLSQKYGKPIEETEEFQGYVDDSDYSRMIAVKSDRCNYSSLFKHEDGLIELYIEKCKVFLLYMDAENEKKAETNAIDDL